MNYRYRIEGVMEKQLAVVMPDGTERPWTFLGSRMKDKAYQYAYRVPAGFSALNVQKQIDALFAACGAHIEISDRAGVVVISVFPGDFPKVIYFRHSMIEGLRGLNVLLGFDRSGNPVTHNFKQHPHLLIGSLPNYGKTTILRLIAYQLLRLLPANMLRLVILDFKMYSYMPFMSVPNVTVATDIGKAYDAVESVMEELKYRAEMVLEHGDRGQIRKFPYIFLIVDEAAQVSPKLSPDRELAKKIDKALARIACLAREARINLIYCTQRPDSEVVNGQIRSMMTAHLGFRTNDEHSSKVIIKSSGLEKLPAKIKGRAIYATDHPTVIQTPYVTAKKPPKGENPEDYAWTRLLENLKLGGEKIADRRSQQGPVETDYLGDAAGGADHLNEPSGADHRLNPWQSPQAGIRDPFGLGKVRDYHWNEPPNRGIKDLAFDANGPINLRFGPDNDDGDQPSDDDETDRLE